MTSARAVRLLFALGWRMDRRRLLVAVLLMAAGYLAMPLLAYGLKLFTEAMLAGDRGGAGVLSVLLGALLVAHLMCTHFAHLDYYELAELGQASLNARLFRAANDDVSLERREQPDYADNLHLAQHGLAQITSALEATLQFGGLALQLVVATVLLARLNPLLALLPLLAFVLIATTHVAERIDNAARQRAAAAGRQAEHLLRLATAPSAVLELRVFGLEHEVVARHRRAWETATGILSRGQLAAAAVRCGGQLLFALGYIGSLYLVFQEAARGSATIGDFVLVLALAVQVGTQISTAVGLLAALQQAGQTAERFDWLAAQRTQPPPEPAGAAPPPAVPAPRPAGRVPKPPRPDGSAPRPAVPAPRSAARVPEPPRPVSLVPPPARSPGITLDAVSFRYPGRAEAVLRDVSVHLPAGAVVAVVGENGAGKSTLVKLLCGLYAPASGSVRVTPADPAAGSPRFACLFQDFARIELTLLESVGVGDVPRLGEPAVTRALGAANAGGLVDELPAGLASVIGQRYELGAELSGGQWQKVALARALMREQVDLLVLDEPAAALDALAEHELFERFAAAARDGSAAARTTTVFVTHRLATVRLADLILVVHDGRLSQRGTHEELMNAAGTYADLFSLQARAYA